MRQACVYVPFVLPTHVRLVMELLTRIHTKAEALHLIIDTFMTVHRQYYNLLHITSRAGTTCQLYQQQKKGLKVGLHPYQWKCHMVFIWKMPYNLTIIGEYPKGVQIWCSYSMGTILEFTSSVVLLCVR